MTPSDKPLIQFNLITNARDSLRRAVELLAWKELDSNQARLKHAISNAAHCIELLLKERLRQVNPAFVWENVDKFPSLDARTVTVDTALSRLRNIGGLQISDADAKNIKAIRATRNAIEHYEWHTTEKEAKLIVGNALSIALSFAQTHLNTDLSDDFKHDDTWKSLVEELYEFVHIHGARLESQLGRTGEFRYCCDVCGQLTVSLQSGSCALCGHWQEYEEA
jgi:hypothetical protein